jgi:hypothetical protein
MALVTPPQAAPAASVRAGHAPILFTESVAQAVKPAEPRVVSAFPAELDRYLTSGTFHGHRIEEHWAMARPQSPLPWRTAAFPIMPWPVGMAAGPSELHEELGVVGQVVNLRPIGNRPAAPCREPAAVAVAGRARWCFDSVAMGSVWRVHRTVGAGHVRPARSRWLFDPVDSPAQHFPRFRPPGQPR